MPDKPDLTLGLLEPSPLGPVACQLGFPDDGRRGASSKEGLDLQRILKQRFADFGTLAPFQETQVSLQMVAGAAASSPPATRPGWRIISRDNVWIVTLLADSLSLECTKYPGWRTGFLDRWLACVDALDAVLSPSLETRLAIRYFNALSSPDATRAAYWIGKVRNTFAGILLDETFQPKLVNVFQRGVMQLGDDLQGIVNMNFRPDAVHDGCIAAVFDIEIGRTTVREFSRISIGGVMTNLRDQANAIFTQVLTEEYLVTLQRRGSIA